MFEIMKSACTKAVTSTLQEGTAASCDIGLLLAPLGDTIGPIKTQHTHTHTHSDTLRARVIHMAESTGAAPLIVATSLSCS